MDSSSLVPKLQLGNSLLEAPGSRLAKLELRLLDPKSGVWEPAQKLKPSIDTSAEMGFTVCYSYYIANV